MVGASSSFLLQNAAPGPPPHGRQDPCYFICAFRARSPTSGRLGYSRNKAPRPTFDARDNVRPACSGFESGQQGQVAGLALELRYQRGMV